MTREKRLRMAGFPPNFPIWRVLRGKQSISTMLFENLPYGVANGLLAVAFLQGSGTVDPDNFLLLRRINELKKHGKRLAKLAQSFGRLQFRAFDIGQGTRRFINQPTG